MLYSNGQRVIAAVVSPMLNRQATTKGGERKNVPYRDVTLVMADGTATVSEAFDMPTTYDDGNVHDPILEKFEEHDVSCEQAAPAKKTKKPTPNKKK